MEVGYVAGLVARLWIKLALVLRRTPTRSRSQQASVTSIPHCLSLSLSLWKDCSPLRPFYPSASILYTSLHFACILHRLLVYPSKQTTALLPARPPVCLQPRDSTHVERRLGLLLPAGCTAPPSTGLVSLSTKPIPPPLISTPKPGSPNRLPLGHHITSDAGVQEHESARLAARW